MVDVALVPDLVYALAMSLKFVVVPEKVQFRVQIVAPSPASIFVIVKFDINGP
jgi:hypothetical protein